MAKVDLYLSKCYSGHMYLNSPYESDNSCGNCDGAKCERCHEMYRVTEYDELGLIPGGERMFRTLEHAQTFISFLEKKAEELG